MKISNALAIFLLPLTALANPIPGSEVQEGDAVKDAYTPRDIVVLRDEEAEEVGLVPRATRTCKIVNVVTTVSCRWNPWHAGWNGKSAVRVDFKPSTSHNFECYAVGECIGGNWLVLTPPARALVFEFVDKVADEDKSTWDWVPKYGCYVPGYYTDSKCTMAALGRCPWPDKPNSNPAAGKWGEIF
ncbi:hypothetical protein V490_03470 [Pseudogymnoascus sp. VKM F-3557]|nr:hypothetical protein V490_03470 [Pseudogymnoascus sp. VKM F-3557]